MAGLDYLAPYLDAAREHDGGFASLLWATPHTQAARFDSICRLEDPTGRFVADIGCGRADFLDFCTAGNMQPADYVGIEAVPRLVQIARSRRHPSAMIIESDFVRNPASMFVGADLLVISGALNTLDDVAFCDSLRRAFDATAEALVFNFLAAPEIAAASYLFWRDHKAVVAFARSLSPRVRMLHDYLHGDCTIAISKD